MNYQIAANGVPYFQFETIPADRVTHGIFTRAGGVSPDPWPGLNFSTMVGDSVQNVRQNNDLAHRALDLDPQRMIDRYLQHTARTWHVDEAQLGHVAPHADGAVTRTAGLSFVMTAADCQPLLAYDPERHVLGVAHAGWRGTLGGMALSLIRAMVIEGSDPAAIVVALGPAIGACCYEVGDEVASRARTWPEGASWLHRNARQRYQLDLNAANEAILGHAGVRRIETSPFCTACRTDLFYSHRAEPPTTGRFAMIAALRPLESTAQRQSEPAGLAAL